MRAKIDLSPDLIRKLCRGNPKNAPRFRIHADDVWPWGSVKMDANKNIHMRRTDFFNLVAPQIPVKPGLWLPNNVQEFIVDLQPHHLGGGSDALEGDTLTEFRAITADRSKCPECGGAMHDLHHSPGARFCQSCNYGTKGDKAREG